MVATIGNRNSRIVIESIVVHKVDHKNFERPVLADLSSTISNDVEVFIRRHISRNRSHKYASTARFRPGSEQNLDSVRVLCEAILQDNTRFITNTRRVAELLFEAQKTGNTSVGELVFCIFNDTLYDGERSIAIMKMDPEVGFVGRDEMVGDQVRRVLEIVEDVLPTGELQKCAFILPVGQRNECDLIVLDQLGHSRGGTRQVASYFLHEFLGAVRDLSNRDLTWGFITHVRDWSERRYQTGEWDLNQVDAFKQAAIVAINTQELIDIPAFLTQQLNDEEAEDNFIDEITELLAQSGRVGNLVFAPDPDVRKKITKTRVYKGDYGLEVRIKTGPEIPKIMTVRPAEATNKLIVTIETATWTEA